MLLWSPTLATTRTIFFLVVVCLLQFALAQAPPPPDHSPHNNTKKLPDVPCRPSGICERCPEEALQQPFCQPFGNRRLMHCDPVKPPAPPTIPVGAAGGRPHHDVLPHRPHPGSPHVPPPLQPLNDDDHNSNNNPPRADSSAWESCGRIVAQERADFWEFVACNVLFAATALLALVVRSRRMHARQARQLAARIGVARGSVQARHG